MLIFEDDFSDDDLDEWNIYAGTAKIKNDSTKPSGYGGSRVLRLKGVPGAC